MHFILIYNAIKHIGYITLIILKYQIYDENSI